MDKRTLMILAVAAAIGGGYWLWAEAKKKKEHAARTAAQEAAERAARAAGAQPNSDPLAEYGAKAAAFVASAGSFMNQESTQQAVTAGTKGAMTAFNSIMKGLG